MGGGGVVGATAGPSTLEKPCETVFSPFIAVFVRFPGPAGNGNRRQIRHSTVFAVAERR
jgi:hypothetical protein